MKSRNGITLIALVITIIVLLILAGISISSITENNSIITRAGEAKNKTMEAQREEELNIEILGSYEENGTLDANTLKENLENIGANVSGNSFPLEVEYKEKKYQVTGDGKLKDVADRTGISVGDYITYTSPTASVSLSTTETGYSEEQTLTRKDTFRVMKINEDGSMLLIGAMTSGDNNIYLTGGLGYNNGVYTLNTKCSDLYKDETRGITARSIKAEDITDKFNDYANTKITDCLDYNFNALSVENRITNLNPANRTATYDNSDYSFATYYPDIIRYEEGCAIDNVPTQGIIGQSDIYNGYNYNGKIGLTNLGMISPYPTSLTLPYTYYDIQAEHNDYADIENAGAFYNMFFGSGTRYYLASRCIGLAEPFAFFNLRIVNGETIDAAVMRISEDEDYGSPANGKVCPIVYIPANVEVNISENPKNQNNINGTAHLIN